MGPAGEGPLTTVPMTASGVAGPDHRCPHGVALAADQHLVIRWVELALQRGQAVVQQSGPTAGGDADADGRRCRGHRPRSRLRTARHHRRRLVPDGRRLPNPRGSGPRSSLEPHCKSQCDVRNPRRVPLPGGVNRPRQRWCTGKTAPLRATPHHRGGAARGRAGPVTGSAGIAQMPSSVTPGRRGAGSTVRGRGCRWHLDDPAGHFAGDVGGAHQVSVGQKSTGLTGEVPTIGSLADPTVRTGAGGPPFIDLDDPDPGPLTLVLQRSAQVRPTPGGRHPAVLDPPRVLGGDALGITHHQGADPVLDGPGHHRLGRLVVGLADLADLTGLSGPLGCPQLAPTLGAPLAPTRGLPPHLSRPALGVFQVQAFFGPQSPAWSPMARRRWPAPGENEMLAPVAGCGRRRVLSLRARPEFGAGIRGTADCRYVHESQIPLHFGPSPAASNQQEEVL